MLGELPSKIDFKRELTVGNVNSLALAIRRGEFTYQDFKKLVPRRPDKEIDLKDRTRAEEKLRYEIFDPLPALQRLVPDTLPDIGSLSTLRELGTGLINIATWLPNIRIQREFQLPKIPETVRLTCLNDFYSRLDDIGKTLFYNYDLSRNYLFALEQARTIGPLQVARRNLSNHCSPSKRSAIKIKEHLPRPNHDDFFHGLYVVARGEARAFERGINDEVGEKTAQILTREIPDRPIKLIIPFQGVNRVLRRFNQDHGYLSRKPYKSQFITSASVATVDACLPSNSSGNRTSEPNVRLWLVEAAVAYYLSPINNTFDWIQIPEKERKSLGRSLFPFKPRDVNIPFQPGDCLIIGSPGILTNISPDTTDTFATILSLPDLSFQKRIDTLVLAAYLGSPDSGNAAIGLYYPST